MSIKRIPLAIEKKTTPSSASVPVTPYTGDDISKFNEAASAKKEAEANLAELRPKILETGLKAIFRLNTRKSAPVGKDVISSTVLQDTTSASVRVTLQSKYAITDHKEVERVFKGIGRDAGDFVTGGLRIDFDSSIFNHPETGDFDETIYRKFEKAIARATKQVEAELREEGVNVSLKTPITAVETFFVKPEFHANRFHDFTPDENLKIQEVIKATCTLTPVAP